MNLLSYGGLIIKGVSVIRELSRITAREGGWNRGGTMKYFGELSGAQNIWRFTGGCKQKHVELFYLKYACQYYGMTVLLGWAMEIVCTSKGGAWKISICSRGALKFFPIPKLFTPPPPCSNCWQFPKDDLMIRAVPFKICGLCHGLNIVPALKIAHLSHLSTSAYRSHPLHEAVDCWQKTNCIHQNAPLCQ